ncbi:MAG: glycosyltransferase, partial [Desulfobacterales bacterium]|nr:glycosyltransferase [Desulfobacterales bacterium]
ILTEIPHHLVVQADPERIPALTLALENNRCRERVHLLAPIDHSWQFYRALECGILAPKMAKGLPVNGIPRELVKAMFSSCPVISTPAGGITDLVVDNQTGLLHSPGDQDGLAGRIASTLIRDAATKERTHAARETVKTRHTIDAMGRNVIRIYRLHQVKLDKQRLPDRFRQI